MLLLAFTANSNAESSISLDKEWKFALDPLDLGEQQGWYKPPSDWDAKDDLILKGWDRVRIPHDFLADPRYEWTGKAWYRTTVHVPETRDPVYRLQFGRVSTKCTVWVNGTKVGSHNGGYTPFEFDVTRSIIPGVYNHIALKVDNGFAIGNLPGPRKGSGTGHQIYPWHNYGGILRSARLLVCPYVHVANQKIETGINFDDGSATILVKVFLKNATDIKKNVRVTTALSNQKKQLTEIYSHSKKVELPPKSQITVSFDTSLPAKIVDLWTPCTPTLYTSKVSVSENNDSSVSIDRASFGIRTVNVDDGKFLLNDNPIRLAGANRVEGHPAYGGLEPKELLELDMNLLKNANLILHRLQHYPLSQEMLDWADKNGMLIILEAPAWGLGPDELGSNLYQNNFKGQFTEMVKSSWNHPSVVGWSVGNEYHAWSKEGVAWTQKFVALSKRLDSTRPTTYAALAYDIHKDAPSREQKSMHWVDFISVNYYASGKNAGKNLDKIHNTWPRKPILISEYGKRVDQATEKQRIQHFKDTLNEVKKRDFVMGMSYWSFNDYRSRYPSTNLNGYRPWGIVDPQRKPRQLYSVMQKELSPLSLIISTKDSLEVTVKSRADFPSMELSDLRLSTIDAYGNIVEESDLNTLTVGSSIKIKLLNSDYEKILIQLQDGSVICEAESLLPP